MRGGNTTVVERWAGPRPHESDRYKVIAGMA